MYVGIPYSSGALIQAKHVHVRCISTHNRRLGWWEPSTDWADDYRSIIISYSSIYFSLISDVVLRPFYENFEAFRFMSIFLSSACFQVFLNIWFALRVLHIYLFTLSVIQLRSCRVMMLARNIYRASLTARPGLLLISCKAGYRTSSPAWKATVTAEKQSSIDPSIIGHQLFPGANIQRHSGWRIDYKEPLTQQNLYAVIANKLSYIAEPGFLSVDECSRLVNVIGSHKIVCMKLYASHVYLIHEKPVLV